MAKVYKFWIALLAIIGAFSFLYFAFLVAMVGLGNGFSYFWLGMFGLCILLIIGIIVTAKDGNIPPKWVAIPVEIIVGAGFLLFIIIEAIIVHGGNKRPPAGADYLIVLGAKVNGTHPSLILQKRIQTAAKYLQENPNTIVIASGGKGSDEAISEAQCISQELEALGIAAERILMEDQSVNTSENLNNSKQIILERDTDAMQRKVVITTTDFHMYRSLHLAKKLGYQEAYGNSAPSVWWLIPTNYTREFFAVMKNVVLGLG